MLLNGRLTLHQPGCDGRRCVPDECIADVEKLARSVISAHERGGVKRNSSLDRRGMTFTASEREDLLAYLIVEAWKARQRFRAGDDGRRPGNRLGGYVVKTLHFRLIDWVRLACGSTRYPAGLIVAELVEYRPELHDAAHYDEYEGLSDGREIDVEALSDEGRAALAMVLPLFGDEPLSQVELAARLGVPQGRVAKGVSLVRRELELQGLAPAGSASA